MNYIFLLIKSRCLRKIETGSSFIYNTFLYNDFMNEIILGDLKPTGEKGDGQKLIKHYLLKRFFRAYVNFRNKKKKKKHGSSVD